MLQINNFAVNILLLTLGHYVFHQYYAVDRNTSSRLTSEAGKSARLEKLLFKRVTNEMFQTI